MTSPSDDDGTPSGDELRRALERLGRDFALAELYVFGSRAAEVVARVGAEEAEEVAPFPSASRSDVDVGVRPLRGRHLGVDDVVRLAQTLEEVLDAPRVDVVVLPGANPFLALEAIRGELLYCADPYEQAEYELYVLRRAGDLAPFQKMREEMALSRYVEP